MYSIVHKSNVRYSDANYTVTIPKLDTRKPDSSKYRTNCMSGFQMVYNHLKTGQKHPVLEWFISLDHFIYKEIFYLHMKWSGFASHVTRRTMRKPDIFAWFSKVVLSKTGPFEIRTKVDHSNTGLVRILMVTIQSIYRHWQTTTLNLVENAKKLPN